MSTITLVPVATTPSYWDSVTTSASNASSWLGRNVCLAGTKMKEWAIVAYEAISAFFARVIEVAAKYGSLAADFVKTHTKEVGIALGGLAVAVGLGCALKNWGASTTSVTNTTTVSRK